MDEDLSAPLVSLFDKARRTGDVEPGDRWAPEPFMAVVPSPSPDILAPRLRFGRCSDKVEEDSSREVREDCRRPGPPSRSYIGSLLVSSGSSAVVRRLRPRTWL